MAPRMVRSASREAGRPRSNSMSGVVAIILNECRTEMGTGPIVNNEKNLAFL
jgi:hypothetical protein